MDAKTKKIVGGIFIGIGTISWIISFVLTSKGKKSEKWYFIAGIPFVFTGLVFLFLGFKQEDNFTDGAQGRIRPDCCKDAQGNTCYPCASVACCSEGFRAGYTENRDIITKKK